MSTIKKVKRFLCIGTEWFPKKGGLSTFNRKLAITLAQCSQEIFCYLPEFSNEEEQDAKQNGITLIKANPSKGLTEIERLCQKPAKSLAFDVIIGHDIVTGPAMKSLREQYFEDAQTLLFIHTAPGEGDWFKPEQEIESIPAKTENKEKKQKTLSYDADLVAAVGPHLYFETQSLLSGMTKEVPLIQFNPGLFKPVKEIDFDFTTLSPETLLVGRVEDYTLKGVDIAVKSMHDVYNKWNITTNGYLVRPKLIIRGLAIGTDKKFVENLKNIETSNLRIQLKNYSPEIDIINEDIIKTALVLMPSRAEGFGLIALESFSNGRPVLVPESSGFAMLLRKIDPEGAHQWIVPNSTDDNIQGWSQKIYSILSDRKRTSQQLKSTVEKYGSSISWLDSTQEILNYLNGEIVVEKTPLIAIPENIIRGPKYIGGGVLKHPDGQYELRARKFDFFSMRIAKAFPGSRSLEWINDPEKAIKRLNILLAQPLTFNIFPGKDDMGGTSSPIWWFRGGASMYIKSYQAISPTKCLIGNHECEIDKIAVYQHSQGYREFVYVRTKAEKSLDARDTEENIKWQMENLGQSFSEYALYRGAFVTREEYDDGAMIIDGEPTQFEEEPELRVRSLAQYNFIITAQSSVYNSPEGDRLFGKFLDEAIATGSDERLEEFIERAEELNAERSFMIDFDI